MAGKHKEKPYGPSSHGRSWGDNPWEDAYKLPASTHLSIGKKFLSKINWYRFIPCREKLILEDEKSCIFAAEIPGQLLLIYVGPPAFSVGIKSIKGLKPDRLHVFSFIDPKDGKTNSIFEFQTDESSMWTFQKPFWRNVSVWQDWVILIKENL